MATLHAKGINGQVSFDGATVVITREGFVARSTHGRSEKAIPVTGIGAVQFKEATSLVNGHLQFSISGETSKKKIGFGKNQDMSKDENAIIFRKSTSDDFKAVVAAIRSAQAAPATAAQPDATEQLAKLAELHKQGVLTDDEFAAKKAELLDRI
ncbi:DUF4429 domain-containing protein [Agromyces humi]|uniref:DUF4429 domain-containing protein n=1 Tax=Agromyces humi TaxID=1766800 RepID=UPI0013591D58|nr:DUF4429 domain-containing protein [Agromyces humi]